MVSAKTELTRGAQHSFGDSAANFSLLDFESPWQRRTNRRERIKRADCDIWCTAHNIVQDSLSCIDFRYPEMIGVRMMSRFDDFSDDDVTQVSTKCDHVVHSRASHREKIAQLRRRHVDVDEVLEPFI